MTESDANEIDLPAGWALKRTRELFSYVTSGSRGWARYYSDAGAAFIRIGDLKRGSLRVEVEGAQRVDLPDGVEGTRTRVHPGDLLVSITADLGIVAVAPPHVGQAYINQHIALARPLPTILPRYLGWFLDSSHGQRQLNELRRGATKAGLGLEDIRNVLVPVAPLDMQERIIAEIEKQFTRLDDAVATLKRVEAKLDVARASVLQAAVEGRLVPTEAELARAEGRSYEPASELLDRVLAERRRRWADENPGKKYKPPVEPETDDLPDLPEGWTWATVDQLFDHRLGKMLDQAKNQGLPRPYLRNANVRWFGFELDDLKRMRVSDEELADVSVRFGDIVVCEGGEPGRAAVWTNRGETAVIQKACHRLRPVPDLAPQFFTFVLAAEATRRLASAFTGSTIKHLTGRKLRPFAMPLPPLLEQRRIVAEVDRRLSVLDALKTNVQRNLARCDRLRQSILAAAFEGRLVPSDALPSRPPTSDAHTVSP